MKMKKVKHRNAAHTVNQKAGAILSKKDKKRKSSRRRTKAKLKREIGGYR